MTNLVVAARQQRVVLGFARHRKTRTSESTWGRPMAPHFFVGLARKKARLFKAGFLQVVQTLVPPCIGDEQGDMEKDASPMRRE